MAFRSARYNFQGYGPESFIRGIAPSEIEAELGRSQTFRTADGIAGQRINATTGHHPQETRRRGTLAR
jgi:hypothetical protein